jgi:hypothetical protein
MSDTASVGSAAMSASADGCELRYGDDGFLRQHLGWILQQGGECAIGACHHPTSSGLLARGLLPANRSNPVLLLPQPSPNQSLFYAAPFSEYIFV